MRVGRSTTEVAVSMGGNRNGCLPHSRQVASLLSPERLAWQTEVGDRGVVDTHCEVVEYEPETARPLHHNRLGVW